MSILAHGIHSFAETHGLTIVPELKPELDLLASMEGCWVEMLNATIERDDVAYLRARNRLYALREARAA